MKVIIQGIICKVYLGINKGLFQAKIQYNHLLKCSIPVKEEGEIYQHKSIE